MSNCFNYKATCAATITVLALAGATLSEVRPALAASVEEQTRVILSERPAMNEMVHRATIDNDPAAMTSIGRLFREGREVPRNDPAAA
ncbi:MAG: hypothetical protein Q7V04_00005, partial [Deltaproteobacteria bacterium]|nr:hypothetical protein [Deltaproteobacteria bacterium]